MCFRLCNISQVTEKSINQPMLVSTSYTVSGHLLLHKHFGNSYDFINYMLSLKPYGRIYPQNSTLNFHMQISRSYIHTL